MKQVMIVLGAFVGALSGSIVRQKFVKGRAEVVIAAHPFPIVAGIVAGLISPKVKPLAAMVVGLNVASNFPR